LPSDDVPDPEDAHLLPPSAAAGEKKVQTEKWKKCE